MLGTLVFVAAIWFVRNPQEVPHPPVAEMTGDSPESGSSDTTATLAQADSAARPRWRVQVPVRGMPALSAPLTGHLFRSIEVRARAGERVAVSITAYCLLGRTRRGNQVRAGIIAVDPALFPLGRDVELFFGRSRYGRFLADDTGGAIRGARIDVWLTDCAAARRFGRKRGYAQLMPRKQ